MLLPTRDLPDGHDRIVSISAAPYDGHEPARVFASLASIVATHVEPAFIVGYTEPFDESAFTPARAVAYAAWVRDAGLRCHAFSSHIDLGRVDAVEVFKGRMDFARALGARVINTNAAHRSNERRFFDNITKLARHAEALDMWIGLENPGDGSDNLLNVASDGPKLLKAVGHPRVGLNYDAGNTISHRPAVPPGDDALAAMSHCVHTHIKDVRRRDEGYFFTPLGEGDIGVARILDAVGATALDLSIEIPLRLHRLPNAQPQRAAQAVPLPTIEAVLASALTLVRSRLAGVPDAGDLAARSTP